jgi:hypothetical protein
MSFREGLYSGSSVNRGNYSSLALGATLPLLVYPPKDCSKEEEATDMDFLVERPLREVLDTAETYMWLQGFHVSLSERTETTSLFSRVYVPKKGFFGTLLSAFVEAPPPVQKIRLLAADAGEGGTRLTVIESRQGELPEEWMEITQQLERWVIEELGGTYWPL